MRNRVGRGIAILLLLALIVGAEIPLLHQFTGEDSFQKTTAMLETQEGRLVKMTLGAVAASTAVAMAPGDWTSPVANELADMTSVFSMALGAVLLEKFLLTKLCWLSLRIIIPVGLALMALYFASRRGGFLQAGIKVALFGLVLMLVIPAGAKVSSDLEFMYQDKLDAALSIHDEVVDAQAEETLSTEEAQAALESESQKTMSWKDALGFFTSIPETVTGAIRDLPDTMTAGLGELKAQAQEWIQTFMMGLAVILISTIVIPIGILLLGLWTVRTITGLPIYVPRLPAPRRKPEYEEEYEEY